MMKYWLPGALSLLIASSAWAQDYRVVTSPKLGLDIWIDNVRDQSAASWCKTELPLRIVAGGNKNPDVLKSFLPRVGSLLETRCATLKTVHWKMNDQNGKTLAQGSADKAQNWAIKVEPETPAVAAVPAQAPAAEAPPAETVVKAEDLSPPADTTPYIQFSLLDGCHFRTYWRSSAQTSALFVPAKGGVTCGSDGWLSGESEIAQMGKGAAKNIRVSFLQGFPVAGLNGKAIGRSIQITTVNNERMVLSDEKSPQSWMIVPYAPEINGWQANGTVVVGIARQSARDESALKARLDEVRKVWAPYLADKTSLTIKLVEEIHPQLKDPAAGSFKTF